MAMHGNPQQQFVGSVTVGERGQVVIPIEARERCAIQPGDKLLAFIYPAVEGVLLVKVEAALHTAASLMALIQQGEPAEAPPEEEGE
jgi:AbrB family looped-hinge helix DNA binding protein